MPQKLQLGYFYPVSPGGPVDPGYGQGGDRPVDPGYGRPDIGPIDPGFGHPLPPVDPGYGRPDIGPIDPGFGNRPTYPVDPGFGIPTPPSTLPVPPRPVRPDNSLPIAPVHPTLPIYLPGGPDNSLPLPPGAVWPPLPPGLGASKVLCFVWIVGIGYRWTVIDPSLQPDNELPPTTVPPLEPPSAVPKTSATSPPPTPTPHR